MSVDAVRAIADAVLYEGYILWPYRRSALKNQQRFTFGGVYPPAHTAAHPDDRGWVRAEVLMAGPDDARVDVTVRFLHVVRRTVHHRGQPVDELVVDGERHLTWDEAVERELRVSGRDGELAIGIPAGSERVALSEDAALVRSWRRLDGRLAWRTRPLGDGLCRVTARLDNVSEPVEEAAGLTRPRALQQTFCSTHIVLHTAGGAFVSPADPPVELAAAVAHCRNEGLWPVLVGDDTTMLCSPIILQDHPRIAPESPGDLFDGGEIDQLLALSILALTDEEKAEMAATDPRAREILQRTEALTPDQMMRLHGTVRR